MSPELFSGPLGFLMTLWTLDMFMQLLGWTGHMLFALSAVPQAWLSYRQGHSRGISRGLLGMWFGGEAIAIAYGLYENVPAPLITNYVVNFICLLVIIRYYVWERDGQKKSRNELPKD